jgi:hypothetical protein
MDKIKYMIEWCGLQTISDETRRYYIAKHCGSYCKHTSICTHWTAAYACPCNTNSCIVKPMCSCVCQEWFTFKNYHNKLIESASLDRLGNVLPEILKEIGR